MFNMGGAQPNLGLGFHSGVQLNALTGRPAAVLYLISPQKFSGQFRRPYEFNFSNQFAQEVNEAVVNSIHSGNDVALAQVLKNPQYAMEIAPSPIQNGYRVDMTTMSESWTFILSIDNACFPGITLAPGNATRSVYTGVCVCREEPINPLTGTLNPSCVLSITHSTGVVKLTSYGAQGPVNQIKTVGDVDIINGQDYSLRAEANAKLHLTTAQEAFLAQTGFSNAAQASHSNTCDVVFGPSTAIQSQTGDIMVNSRSSDPTVQLKTVVNAVKKAAETIDGSNCGGPLDISTGGVANSSMAAISMFGTELADPVNLQMGVQEGMILLSEIINTYHPQIERINVPQITQLDVRPQEYDSRSNVASAMLTSILPSTIMNYGLDSLAFVYHYEVPNGGSFKLDYISGAVDLNDAELKRRFGHVLRRLENEIFPIIYMFGGDFDLMAFVTTSGVTRMTLNFLSQDNPDMGVYEVPTLLGGYNSMVIGREETLRTNCNALYRLANIALDDSGIDLSGSDMNRINNQPSRGYMPHYSQMPSMQPTPAYAGMPVMGIPQQTSIQPGMVTPSQQKPITRASGEDWL